MAFPYRVMAWRPSLEISMLHMDITHSFAATKQLNEKEKVKSWHRKGRTHLPQNQKKSRDRIPNIPWVYHLAQKKNSQNIMERLGICSIPNHSCPGAPIRAKKKLPWRTDLLTTRKSTEGIEVSCIRRPRTIWPSGLVIFWILPPKKEDLYPSLETCVKSGLKLEFVKKFWTACLGFLENSSISTCYNKLFSSGNLTQQWNEWSSEWILGFSRANETYERMFLPSLKLRIRSRQSEQWTEAFASLKYHRSNNADEGAEK